MTTLIRIQRKGQMILPSSFRDAMGVREGSLVELSLENGKAIISPQVPARRKNLAAIPKNRKAVLDELAGAVAELRQDAKEKGVDKMSKREINAAVAWARRDLRKTGKPVAK